MDIKKKVSLLLAVLAVVATATACGGEETPSGDDRGESRTEWTGSTSERGDTGEESQTSDSGREESHETDRDTETEIETEDETETEGNTGTAISPEVYDQEGLVRIDTVENGAASFLIHKSGSTYHWGTGGTWTGTYYYGFIDLEGNVIVDPKYECNPYTDLPTFEYNYTKVGDSCIIDRKGNAMFTKGSDGVSEIGQVSHGYFWVETMEETLAGNVYTVRYYSADDLSVVATFDNIRAIPDGMTIGGKNSAVTESGDVLLVYRLDLYSWGESDMFTFSIGDYDSTFTPVNDSNWTVDVGKVEEFSVATYHWHTVSEDTDGAGLIAAVRLESKDHVEYYATVDGQGNVLMQPQRNVEFPELGYDDAECSYIFNKGLCPARDANSGYWGYIDAQGNWKIQPQYTSVTAFSSDGYAIIDKKIVIDTNGNAILSPAGWQNKQVTSLSGKYKLSDSGYYTYYLIFTADGELTYKEVGISTETGHYQVRGGSLEISDMGKVYVGAINGDGTYSFRLDGNKLYIDDKEWTLVEE